MLMSEDCCDSMFDIDCLLLKEERGDFNLHATSSPIDIMSMSLNNDSSKGNSTDIFDPFFGNNANALKLAVDRQASLDDLAHVIRADSALGVPSLTDGADTIQDLAKYLKDDTQNSPTIPNLIAAASAGFSFPSSSTPAVKTTTAATEAITDDDAPMHNYASRRPPVTDSALRFPVLIKQERPDTPCSDLSDSPPRPAEVRKLSSERRRSGDDHFHVVYTPAHTVSTLPAGSIYPRRKRAPALSTYKEEPMDDGYGDADFSPRPASAQSRDADLPPPRKYVRKNPKQIKDLDEYRKRRERNNEAVRRARAKKRQTEALIHSENRHLRNENNRLQTELEATRLQVQTQERMLAQLRGGAMPPLPSPTQPSARLKKPHRRT